MNYAIAVKKLSDGRDFVTAEDIAMAGEEGANFIRRFSNYYKFDELRQGWVGPKFGAEDGPR